eukprot:TRINITY_DN324_c7_g1_i1.p1 TRINITY_DN324_c7_g1~~TRINITY_DN324_c7_g1_i1.p1  ORF type:complete len:150 (+),score=24.78 TRINITY_DN324_c7_g1_i1:92-541(+)
MSVRLLKLPLATDVILSEDANGNQVVGVEAVGGDYMVVPIEIKGNSVRFKLKVDGFGFEIGQHSNEAGATRKLTDPFLSMIPAPAKKAAGYPARTGTFEVIVNGRELMVEIPEYDGPPVLKKYTMSDPTKLSMVLGGQVFVTLSGVSKP